MKGCSVCGSSEEHFDGSDCVDHLLARIEDAEKRANNVKQVEFPSRVEKVTRVWRAKCEDAETRLREVLDAAMKIIPDLHPCRKKNCGHDWCNFGRAIRAAKKGE